MTQEISKKGQEWERTGLCRCGCGQKTRISEYTNARKGWKAGEPRWFINGHNHVGERHWNYRRGYTVSDGTMRILDRQHPMSDGSNYVKEHRAKIATMLGWEVLPRSIVVHHIDGNPLNNEHDNLVVCQNQSYHSLLHARLKALNDCGNPSYRKCCFCHKYDDVSNMSTIQRRNFHQSCANQYARQRKLRIKERTNV